MGEATFSGGQILNAATFLPADRSVVYGTASNGGSLGTTCPGCLPTITINFSATVSDFSVLVINGNTVTVTYTVQDNQGGSQSIALVANFLSGSGTLTLPSTGISQVTITSNATPWDFFIDNVSFVPGGLQIIRPNNNDEFHLTDSSFTQTSPITFEAQPIAAGATVNWTLQLNYATSGGYGSFQDIRNFTTDSTTPMHEETYASTGGKITVQAKETGSSPQSASPITFYVVGTAIPEAEITSRLVSLYGGATPNLMTGIAWRESTYHQFVTRSLFGVSALWPTESPPDPASHTRSGGHIGLMQMPVNQADAWDWKANTADGTNFFLTSKLPTAVRLMKAVIASHPGLRQLTPVELEQMAVCLYGDGAKGPYSQQYYVAVPTASGGWDWAVTKANPEGVAYTKFVFSNLR